MALAFLGASQQGVSAGVVPGGTITIQLRKLERRTEFGTRAGEALGRIQDVLVSNGRVFVLDSRQMRIAMFDTSGTPRGIFGRPGSAIGELRHPGALMAGRADELLVADAALRRVVRFQARPDSLKPLEGFDVGMSPSDACTFRDIIVLSGYKNGAWLHLFSVADGARVRSFGDPLRQGGPLLQSTLDGSHVLCMRRRQAIVFASQLLGTVRAFRSDGNLLWTRTVPGFREALVRELPTGGVVHESPPDGYNHIVEMLSVSDTLVVLQTVTLSQENPSADRASTIRTLLLSASTGEIVGEQHDLPRLAAADARRLYERVMAPQPSVVSHSFAVMRRP
jgi:hypothetical protein